MHTQIHLNLSLQMQTPTAKQWQWQWQQQRTLSIYSIRMYSHTNDAHIMQMACIRMRPCLSCCLSATSNVFPVFTGVHDSVCMCLCVYSCVHGMFSRVFCVCTLERINRNKRNKTTRGTRHSERGAFAKCAHKRAPQLNGLRGCACARVPDALVSV